MNTMEYGKAFSYLADDDGWIKKFLIAALMPVIPILGGFVLAGYSLEITRRVIKQQAPTLPDWSDFGEYLKNGFLAVVVGLVYALPALVAVSCFNGPAIALQAQSDSNLQLVGVVLGACGGCLVAGASLFAALLIPAALGLYADKGDLGAALRVGDVLKLLRTKPGVYIVSALLIGLVALILMPLGFLACGVGIFAAVTYLNLATAHLHGQAYRVAAAESGMA